MFPNFFLDNNNFIHTFKYCYAFYSSLRLTADSLLLYILLLYNIQQYSSSHPYTAVVKYIIVSAKPRDWVGCSRVAVLIRSVPRRDDSYEFGGTAVRCRCVVLIFVFTCVVKHPRCVSLLLYTRQTIRVFLVDVSLTLT